MRSPIIACALGFSIGAVSQNYSWVGTYAGDGSPGLVNGAVDVARFHAPYGIAIDDSAGVMYVADAQNHCIRRIQNGGVSTLAGSGSQGDQDGQGANARFYVPTGVYYHDGHVYVTDNGNHKVKRIDQQGNVVTIAGTGAPGTTNGPGSIAKFYNPVEVAVRHDGVVFVSDYGNHTIRKIENGVVSTFAGNPGNSGDQLGTGINARFNRPTGIAFDTLENLYVADQMNHKVKVISSTGVVSLLAGNGNQASVDGLGPAASFTRPTYMAWDPTGGLMVAEWMGNLIRRITLQGSVTTVAGTGQVGYFDGPVLDAMFNAPYGIAVDTRGNAYIGDKENHVVRYLAKEGESLLNLPDLSTTTPLILHPNPASTMATVRWPGPSAPATVELIDGRGARVQADVRRFADRVELDVAALPAGLYTVRLSGDALVGTARLVRD